VTPTEETLVLFQKFSFSQPIESFFVVKFSLNDGKGRLVCKLNANDVTQIKSTIIVKNMKYIGFWLSSTKNKRYRLFYAHTNYPKRYSTYLIDTHTNTIIKKILRRDSSCLNHHFFYIDALGKGLIEFNKVTKRERQITNRVRAIASTPLGMWGFYDNGKIRKIFGNHDAVEGQYKGLVTEAGHLAKNWIWFSQRKNEKAYQGDVWIMDMLTGKTHTARSWWKKKWGNSVAINHLGADFKCPTTAARQKSR
jgi:hypothetical protein